MIQDSAGTKLAYVSLDNGMVSQLLRTRLMRRLQEQFGGALNESNVMISGEYRCPRLADQAPRQRSVC